MIVVPRQPCIACVPLREKQALVLFKALFFWVFCPLKPVSILIFIALFSSFVFIYQPYQDLSHHLPISLGIISFISLNSFQSRCNTHQEVAQCCIVTSESVHRCAHCVQMLFSLSLCLCRGRSVCRADSKTPPGALGCQQQRGTAAKVTGLPPYGQPGSTQESRSADTCHTSGQNQLVPWATQGAR